MNEIAIGIFTLKREEQKPVFDLDALEDIRMLYCLIDDQDWWDKMVDELCGGAKMREAAYRAETWRDVRPLGWNIMARALRKVKPHIKDAMRVVIENEIETRRRRGEKTFERIGDMLRDGKIRVDDDDRLIAGLNRVDKP